MHDVAHLSCASCIYSIGQIWLLQDKWIQFQIFLHISKVYVHRYNIKWVCSLLSPIHKSCFLLLHPHMKILPLFTDLCISKHCDFFFFLQLKLHEQTYAHNFFCTYMLMFFFSTTLSHTVQMYRFSSAHMPYTYIICAQNTYEYTTIIL